MLKYKNQGKGQSNGFTAKNITFEAEPAQKRAKKRPKAVENMPIIIMYIQKRANNNKRK